MRLPEATYRRMDAVAGSYSCSGVVEFSLFSNQVHHFQPLSIILWFIKREKKTTREIDLCVHFFLQASFAFNCTAVHLRWLFSWHFQQHYSPAIQKKVKGVFPKCSFWKIKHGVTFHPARQILMRGTLNEDPTGSSYQNDIKHPACSRPGSMDTNGDLKSFAVIFGQNFL